MMEILNKATFYTLDLLLTLIPPPSHLIIDHCMCLLKFVLILGVFLNDAALTPSFICFLYCEQKKERECMQLRIAVLRSELQRQRKALGREIDLQQKEKSQLQKKGRVSIFIYLFI